MDLGTTIIAIVIILVCITPFVMMNMSNRKREKKFLESLSVLAKRSGSTITQHDSWRNAAIGIDETANTIFFIKQIEGIETSQQVALTEINKCRVINTSRTSNNKDDNFKVIDKLELAFDYFDKNSIATVLEFYDVTAGRSTLSNEMQLVTKWCEIANNHIKGI